MAMTELLEELRGAFLGRGCDVDRHLQPGLPRAEILASTRPLDLELPEVVVELYEWRNGQGITMYYHSIRSMLETCIAWVREPRWTKDSDLGLHPDVEREIWGRHNPGIFG